MPDVVIHEPDDRGARRVTIRGTAVGRAYSVADVEEFLRRAGTDDPDPADPATVEWRGPGPDWAA